MDTAWLRWHGLAITPRSMADVPVSIVIRTLNAAATLRPVLEALRRNPDYQLILVDS